MFRPGAPARALGSKGLRRVLQLERELLGPATMSRPALLLAASVVLVSACSEQGTVAEAFPAARVEIVVDDSGVPHVYAQSDADAFYGAGYQMTVDRPYQVDTLRRQAFGRLSEVIGQDGLSRDELARTMGLAKWGQADAALTRQNDPERARWLRAWVAGINARVDQIRSGAVPVPFGFREHDFLPERWNEDDAYVVLKGAGLAMDQTIDFEVAITILDLVYPDVMGSVRLLQPAHPVFAVPPEDAPAGTPAAGTQEGARRRAPPGRRPQLTPAQARATFDALAHFLAFERGGGSNNWAVDGRFTESGRPLIAGDPHLPFGSLGAPYPMQMNSREGGGTFDVAGFAFPGTPGIALGQTDGIVWTETSAFADVTDAWTVSYEGSGVRVGTQVVPYSVRLEDILVRDPGAPAGVGQKTTLEIHDVPDYGVILPEKLLPLPVGGPFLVKWTGMSARPVHWFLDLNRARSIDDFTRAVGSMEEMTFNFVAADARSIAYRTGVAVPARDVAPGREPWQAMDGSDPKSLWAGQMLPSPRLPEGRARMRGWIATSNNDPFGFTADGVVDDDPWYYGSLFDPGYRASRATSELERLTARGRLTPADMETLQTDVHSTLADDLLPLLSTAHDHVATDASLASFRSQPELDALVTMLHAWDRRMARDSTGALAFQGFLHELAAEVLQKPLGMAYDFAIKLETVFVFKIVQMVARGDFPDAMKYFVGGLDATLLRAAQRTATWIDGRWGAVAHMPTYGTLKQTSFDGAFGYDMPVFHAPTDGGEDTIQISEQISFDESATAWTTDLVPVERSVGDFAADGTPELSVSYPVGNAADPTSADTRSANDDYVNGRYRKLLFSRADVDGHARSHVVLPAAK